MYASENGQYEIVELLLKVEEIDVDAKDNLGKTALMYGSENGHYKVVKWLLDNEEINVSDDGCHNHHVSVDRMDVRADTPIRMFGTELGDSQRNRLVDLTVYVHGPFFRTRHRLRPYRVVCGASLYRA